MDLNTITTAAFKARFYRDFTYYSAVPDGTNEVDYNPDWVQDRDITNAFGDAQALLNQGLFSTDTVITNAYLFLSAHCLCVNIRSVNGGINGPGALPVSARAVGSVSESYGIPAEYLNSPILADYTQTTYGLKYLSIALPAMVGNMAGVYGGTNP